MHLPEAKTLCCNMKTATLALHSTASAHEPCDMPSNAFTDMADDRCCAADHPQARSQREEGGICAAQAGKRERAQGAPDLD